MIYKENKIFRKMFIVTEYAALKKHIYSVLLLHLLKPLFSVFHVFQALIIFFFKLANCT